MAQSADNVEEHVTPGGPQDDEVGEAMSVASEDEGDNIETIGALDENDDQPPDNNDNNKNKNNGVNNKIENNKNGNNDNDNNVRDIDDDDGIPSPPGNDNMVDGDLALEEGLVVDAEEDFVPPKGNLQQFLKTNSKFKQKPPKKVSVDVHNDLQMNMNASSGSND